MRALTYIATAVVLPLNASIAMAGMTQDLADCPNPKRAQSAAACTRILSSGRLIRSQYYIAHYNRGWAYRLAGNHDLALKDFDRAAALRPNFAKTFISRGSLHRDMGNLESAVSDFDRAIKLEPKNWEGYFYRARSMRDLGRRYEALKDLDRAVSYSPDQREVKTLQALLLAERGEYKAALDVVDKIVKSEPNDAMAHYVRAVALNEGGDRRSALRESNRTLEIEPGFTAARTLRGRILEREGRIEDARQAYTEVLNAPLKHFDAALASATARSRLAALDDKSRSPTATVPSNSGTSLTVADKTCRRYIPAAAATIIVNCE